MSLKELLWDEATEAFVWKEDKRKVLAFAVGPPTGIFLCNRERDGITTEEAIAEHAPRKANAFCTSNIRIPNPNDSPQRAHYEIQYYQAFSS